MKTTKILSIVLCFILIALALVACAPKKDPEKAKASLESNGYEIHDTVDYLAGIASAIMGSKIDATVTATKEEKDADGNSKTEYIVIIYYKTSADAKAAWEDAQKNAEEDKTGDDSDWVVARSGRMIYWGTKAAVKAAS